MAPVAITTAVMAPAQSTVQITLADPMQPSRTIISICQGFTGV